MPEHRPRLPPSAPSRPDGLRGRGASVNPANRFEAAAHDGDPEAGPEPAPTTTFIPDRSRTALTTNDSPDLDFDTSLNPYRGCEHGCAYCYARPTHEYLGYSAGLDFESKILVKEHAPELLRAELLKPSWVPRTVMMSGVTDCYQPVERRLRLTRRCLEVFAEFRNPVALITKNRLIERDADLLGALAGHGAAVATLSITTLRPELSAVLEPRASSPPARLAAIRALTAAGVPAGVNVAPIIPGLNDHEVPAILDAARAAGAVHAGFTIVRLPHAVAPLFERWLDEHAPLAKDKVLNRIRAVRGGALNDPRFGSRMHGEGPWARQIADLFALARRRAGFPDGFPLLSAATFRRPGEGVQQTLW